MSAGLFLIAVAVGAPPAAPVPDGLQKGDQFTYVGSVEEAVDRPGERFRRRHELELRVLVLERREKWSDAAVLTRLKRSDDAVAGAAGAVTGAVAHKDAPPLIRLEIVRVHADGSVHLLAPPGPVPLQFDADTPASTLPLVPLDSFAPFEFGVFPPHPPRLTPTEPWSVAVGGMRPNETWQAKEPQFLNAERCQYLVMNQQSADWAKPAGGQVAWHRADAVWVSTQDGTARKVHRVIRQREGRAESPPAAWIEVNYELKDKTNLTGRTLDRARRDVEVAFSAFTDSAKPLGAKTFARRLIALDAHIEASDSTGAYREALAAARRALEAARRGVVAPVQPTPGLIPAAATIPTRTQWPEPGQIAHDFRAGEFHLAAQKGKSVILVFLKPNGETSELALTVADALSKRYAGKVAVVPLVVYGDLADAVKERDRLKLTVPLYDGAGAGTAYGVETVPRFAVIDPAGKVRWTFSGIGAETGYLVREEADRLVPPASPAAPRGTIASPGSLGVPLVPPP